MKHEPPDVGPLLGKKIQPPKLKQQDEYVEAPDIGPYFWRHVKTGQLKYAPPLQYQFGPYAYLYEQGKWTALKD